MSILEDHSAGTRSWKITNENVQTELNRRSMNDVIQTYMPSVRLTSTVDPNVIYKYKNTLISPNPNGGLFFSVGTHGLSEQELETDTIFNLNTTVGPIVGYTHTQGNNEAGHTILKASQFNFSSQTHVPPVGVTKLNVYRNTNDSVAKFSGTIFCPTLEQLNALQAFFLIPGIGILLELINATTTAEGSPSAVFNKHGIKLNQAQNLLDVFVDGFGTAVSYRKLLEEIVWPSGGQVGIVFGRLSNIRIMQQGTSFEVYFEAVGVADFTQGVTLQDTVVVVSRNLKDTQIKANSIKEYFKPNNRFDTLLSLVSNGTVFPEWKQHILFKQKGNLSEILKENADPNLQKKQILGASENPVFISWPFFVNVILNDRDQGIRSLFPQQYNEGNQTAGVPANRALPLIAELAGYTPSNPTSYRNVNEPYVGSHRFLRSTELGTMILYNERAQIAIYDKQYNYPLIDIHSTRATAEDDRVKYIGSLTVDEMSNGRGLLSRGVWLNIDMVRECFYNSTTLLEAINKILANMNRAVQNYWELGLDWDENLNLWVIVDYKFNNLKSKILAEAVKNAYVFNNATISRGSECVELNFELRLSSLLAATLVYGTGYKSDSETYIGSMDTSAKKLLTIDDGYDVTRVIQHKPPRAVFQAEIFGNVTNSELGVKTKSGMLGSSFPVPAADATKTNIPATQPSPVSPTTPMTPNQKTNSSFRVSELDFIFTKIFNYEGNKGTTMNDLGGKHELNNWGILQSTLDSYNRSNPFLKASVSELTEEDAKKVGTWLINPALKYSTPGLRFFASDTIYQHGGYRTIFKAAGLTESGGSLESLRDERIRYLQYGWIDNIKDPAEREAQAKLIPGIVTRINNAYETAKRLDASLPMDYVAPNTTNDGAQALQGLGFLSQETADEVKSRNDFNEAVLKDAQAARAAFKDYEYLLKTLIYIEYIPRFMRHWFLNDVTQNPINVGDVAINNLAASGIVPLYATLRIPGIAGIRVGELVKIARVPDIVKDGLFWVNSIEDEITPRAWFTTLTLQFLPLPPIILNI